MLKTRNQKAGDQEVSIHWISFTGSKGTGTDWTFFTRYCFSSAAIKGLAVSVKVGFLVIRFIAYTVQTNPHTQISASIVLHCWYHICSHRRASIMGEFGGQFPRTGCRCSYGEKTGLIIHDHRFKRSCWTTHTAPHRRPNPPSWI